MNKASNIFLSNNMPKILNEIGKKFRLGILVDINKITYMFHVSKKNPTLDFESFIRTASGWIVLPLDSK